MTRLVLYFMAVLAFAACSPAVAADGFDSLSNVPVVGGGVDVTPNANYLNLPPATAGISCVFVPEHPTQSGCYVCLGSGQTGDLPVTFSGGGVTVGPPHSQGTHVSVAPKGSASC